MPNACVIITSFATTADRWRIWIGTKCPRPHPAPSAREPSAKSNSFLGASARNVPRGALLSYRSEGDFDANNLANEPDSQRLPESINEEGIYMQDAKKQDNIDTPTVETP